MRHSRPIMGIVCVVVGLLSVLATLLGRDAEEYRSARPRRTLAHWNAIPQFPPSSDGFFKSTPMVAVLADPARFEGKRIRLTGFVGIGPEGDVLSLDQESLLYSIDGNCMYLDISFLAGGDRDVFRRKGDGRCCRLVGVVVGTRGGPEDGYDIFPCTLVVTAYTIHEERAADGAGAGKRGEVEKWGNR